MTASPRALNRPARPVRRQLQHRRGIAQLSLPIIQLFLEHRAGEPFPLPGRIVRILDRQLLQRRRLTRGKRLVQRRQLADEHPHRPAVGNDMVHGQQEHVLGSACPQQADPKQRTCRQIKGTLRLGDRPAADLLLPLRFRYCVQIHYLERHKKRLGDPLHRAPVHRRKRGPQRLVPAHDLVQAGPQRRHIQRSGDPDRSRHVVEGAARLQLVQEPQPLLSEGKRQIFGPLHRLQRRDRIRASLVSGAIDDRGQSGYRRLLEQLAQGDFRVERVAEA